MVNVDDIRPFFPHETPRPNQLEWIASIVNAFIGGAKNVVVEAPTGSGKTPAIVAVASYFTSKYSEVIQEALKLYSLSSESHAKKIKALEDSICKHQAYIITSMKLLQDQYRKESSTISIVKGRSNYRCNDRSGSGMSCEDFYCITGSTCKVGDNSTSCEYMKSRVNGKISRLTLFNFDSFINQVSMGEGSCVRSIVSIDEAHNADEKLSSAMKFSISDRLIRSIVDVLESEIEFDLRSVRAGGKEATVHMEALSSKIGMAMEKLALKKVDKKTVRIRRTSIDDALHAGRTKDRFGKLKRSIDRYIMSHEYPWSISGDDSSIEFEPVISRPFAKSALLAYGDRRLLMSATIFDGGRRVMSALGLKRDETEYIEVPSTFHAKNRRLVPVAAANMSYGTIKAEMKSAISAIESIIDSHKGEAGVIHCNSYDLANTICDNIKSDRLVFHGKDDKSDKIARFMSRERPDMVLVGVYIKEGYDFRDDIARFQIITRIPYPYPTDKMKLRNEMEPGYNDWLAAIDLVQMCGRGVRSESDSCVNYCIDSRLVPFMTRNRNMIPAWFRESVY